jgi:hypothetical protein
MESISITTSHDFGNASSLSAKRKHSSIACDPCRRLKIRCIGGGPEVVRGRSLSTPCENCTRASKLCQWPEGDRRKRQKLTTADSSSQDLSFAHPQREYSGVPSQVDLDFLSTGQQNTARQPGLNPTAQKHVNHIHDVECQLSPNLNAHHNSMAYTSNAFPRSELHEADHTTVQYARHLGATAIAPGHQKISLKVKTDDVVYDTEASSTSGYPTGRHSESHDPHEQRFLPIFDETTGLPSGEILPILLDIFFEYYGDNFCFLNRSYLDQLLETGDASIFLICTICALSSRFGTSAIFVNYFPHREEKHAWEYAIPFLHRAKELLMPLLNVPSVEVVAGLLLLSWAEFGDNNEAGKRCGHLVDRLCI